MSSQKKDFVHKYYMKYMYLILILFVIVIACTANFYVGLIRSEKNAKVDSDYTTLNLYLLKTTKMPGVKIDSFGLVGEDMQSYYITFENSDGTKNTFIKQDSIIYYNKIKLCENVDSFKVIVDRTGKESISAETVINNKTYTAQYVIE